MFSKMLRALSIVVLLAETIAAMAARAAPWTFTVRAENDYPANTDRYYSSGMALAYSRCVSDDEALWPRVLRFPGLHESGTLSQGFDLGQIMVTPADISREVPDPNDRPYAGLLFFGASWQRASGRQFTAFKLVTGIVGPASLAEQTQREFHELIGSEIPQGWDRQLRNEPILNAVYERRWRVTRLGGDDGWSADVLAIGGGMLGNVLTQAYGHAQVRLGWRVPHDFGTSLLRGIGTVPPARDSPRWGAHLFFGAGGFAVARNVTLDGNSFRDGPSVDKRPFVSAVEAGVAVRGRGWQLTASWVAWGREFENQPRHAEFGTLAFSLFQ